MKLFYFATWTFATVNFLAIRATASTSANARQSPKLLRRRGLSQVEITMTPQATKTGEDIHRALDESFAISALRRAFGTDLDWRLQQNSGSLSFPFLYPLVSLSYPLANTYLSFSYPPFGSDLSFSYPPFRSDLSLSYPPFGSDLSLSYPPFGSDLSFSYPPFDSDLSFSLPPLRSDLSFSFPPFESDLSFSFPRFGSDLSFSFLTVETDLSFSLSRGGWSFSFPPTAKDRLSFSFPNIDDIMLSSSMSYPPSISSEMSFSFSYLDRSDVNGPIDGIKKSIGTTGDSLGTHHDNKDTLNQGGISSSDNAKITSKAGASNSNSPADEAAKSQGHDNSPVDTSANDQEHNVEPTGKASNNNAGAGSTKSENDLANNVPSSIDRGITSRGKSGDDISVGVLITVVSGMVVIFGLVFVALSRKLRWSQYGSAAAASLFGSDGSADSSVSAAETRKSGSTTSSGVGAVAV